MATEVCQSISFDTSDPTCRLHSMMASWNFYGSYDASQPYLFFDLGCGMPSAQAWRGG